jgi:hypothetical protein
VRRGVVRNQIFDTKSTVAFLQETKLALIDEVVVRDTLGPKFANNFSYFFSNQGHSPISITRTKNIAVYYITRNPNERGEEKP